MGDKVCVVCLDWQFKNHSLDKKLVPFFAEMTGHSDVPRWVTEDDSVLGFLNQVSPDRELGKPAAMCRLSEPCGHLNKCGHNKSSLS